MNKWFKKASYFKNPRVWIYRLIFHTVNSFSSFHLENPIAHSLSKISHGSRTFSFNNSIKWSLIHSFTVALKDHIIIITYNAFIIMIHYYLHIFPFSFSFSTIILGYLFIVFTTTFISQMTVCLNQITFSYEWQTNTKLWEWMR